MNTGATSDTRLSRTPGGAQVPCQNMITSPERRLDPFPSAARLPSSRDVLQPDAFELVKNLGGGTVCFAICFPSAPARQCLTGPTLLF